MVPPIFDEHGRRSRRALAHFRGATGNGLYAATSSQHLIMAGLEAGEAYSRCELVRPRTGVRPVAGSGWLLAPGPSVGTRLANPARERQQANHQRNDSKDHADYSEQHTPTRVLLTLF
jgi:hypothetical protein